MRIGFVLRRTDYEKVEDAESILDNFRVIKKRSLRKS